MKKPKAWLTYVAVMISVILWAANLPATRYIMQYYSFGSLALFRFVVAAVCLGAVAAKRKTALPKKKDMPMFVFSGFVGVFLFTIFLNIGALRVVAGVSSFLINSSPVYALIFAYFLLGEKVKPACWIGILISLAGLIGVMIAQTAEFSLDIGIFLLVLAGISYGLYSVLQRFLFKRDYAFFEVVTFSLIAGTVFFVIFIPDLIHSWRSGLPFHTHLVVILMGVLPAAVANLTWGYALATAEKTAHVTAFLYLTPFLAALIGFLWLGETFSVWSLLGGIVIVGGMILTNTLGKSK